MRRQPSLVATSVSPVTHGLLALMRPSAGHVCHSLIVVSNWRPGSAHAHAAYAILSQRSLAETVLAALPSVRRMSVQSLPCSTASRKSFVTRTELFEFWPDTVTYASESQSRS